MKIKKILIANRGEIALRIIRACKEMEIKTVAIHSTADEYSLHRKFADEDVCIGPPNSTESYLYIPNIISAAEITEADAIHPGYGFLSENSRFAEICEENNIKFIGPSKTSIKKMGNKAKAREIVKNLGFSIITGSNLIESIQQAKKIIEKMKFPLIIKAVAGGGGRGMRVVKLKKDFEKQFELAQSEALKSFGSSTVYLEEYLENPRHIEIQILSDKKGNIIHLGERDCSIQRKHQKLIEESPSPFISNKLRSEMGEVAISIAKEVNYYGAGTVEFLIDEKGNYYFIEMNTRIQVEHPVTEMITGIDLIKEQIRVANEESLIYKSNQIKLNGHAIECRINSENSFDNFKPSSGKINSYHVPGGFGIRVDSHLYADYEIPPYYDSLLSKIIVWAPNRSEAISRMKRALNEYVIEGVYTTIPFHKQLLQNEDFIKGKYSTQFLEKFNLMSIKSC